MASVFVTGALLPAAPHAAAVETCQGISRPGITITVAGQPVRIPAINVSVCVDTPDPMTLVPALDIIDHPVAGSPCETECFVIQLRFQPDQPATVVSVSVTLDGNGVSRTVTIPHPPTWVCLVSSGEPVPLNGNCLIIVDPDD